MSSPQPSASALRSSEVSKSCFVIAPIGEPDSETRKRSDQVFKYVIAKAIEPLGYSVLRADKISQPGMITLQVLENVMEAELVVADLTTHNPNVFYELAVRHAVQKPVIHIIDSAEVIPFDVSDFRTVKFDYHDLASVEAAKAEIERQATQIEQGNLGETPIKLASLIQRLQSGESQDKEVLGQLLDTLLQVRKDVKALVSEAENRQAEARRRPIITLPRPGAGTAGTSAMLPLSALAGTYSYPPNTAEEPELGLPNVAAMPQLKAEKK